MNRRVFFRPLLHSSFDDEDERPPKLKRFLHAGVSLRLSVSVPPSVNQSSTLHAVQRDKAQIRGINEMTANASAGQLEAQSTPGPRCRTAPPNAPATSCRPQTS